MRTRHRVAVLAALAVLCASAPAYGIWVFFTPQEALQVAFADEETVARVSWRDMAPQTKAAIREALGRSVLLPVIRCYQGSRDGEVLAYACIDNVIGRSRPITYLLKIDHPEGHIAFYEVMVYRESIGKEVRKGAFREQFLGKTREDPLRFGTDLRNYTGATLSSHHLRDGFRKLLVLYEHYLSGLPVLAPQG